MDDGGAKGSQQHSSTDHEPADDNHRSAAKAIHKYAAKGSWTEEKERRRERTQRPLRSEFAAPALNVPLTSCVHRSKHDGGNPGDLAVGNRKVCLDLLVVDGEGLGKGVGEAYGEESAQDDGPAPASIGWCVA